MSRDPSDSCADAGAREHAQFDAAVRVVVSCTDRKRLPVAPKLRLQDYLGTLEERATKWLGRLASPRSEQCPAIDLYAGEQWSVVKQLDDAARGAHTRLDLWIASAGYGLLHQDEPVESYAATFATRSPDSVSRNSETVASDAREWWQHLCDRPRPSSKQPASLAELAAQDRDTPLLVALSGSYVRAVRDDLLKAGAELGQRLFLVSAGSRDRELEEFMVPCDARLVDGLGGTRLSLNVRVARQLLANAEAHGWEGEEVRRAMSAVLDDQPPPIRYDRAALSDEAVRRFIRQQLDRNGKQSRTSMLRLLRDAQFACEQKRFAELYSSVLEGVAS